MWSIAAEIRQVHEFKKRAKRFRPTEPNIYAELAQITEMKIELLKKANNIPVPLREIYDIYSNRT